MSDTSQCRAGCVEEVALLLLGNIDTVLSVAAECIQLEEHETAGLSICVKNH